MQRRPSPVTLAHGFCPPRRRLLHPHVSCLPNGSSCRAAFCHRLPLPSATGWPGSGGLSAQEGLSQAMPCGRLPHPTGLTTGDWWRLFAGLTHSRARPEQRGSTRPVLQFKVTLVHPRGGTSLLPLERREDRVMAGTDV